VTSGIATCNRDFVREQWLPFLAPFLTLFNRMDELVCYYTMNGELGRAAHTIDFQRLNAQLAKATHLRSVEQEQLVQNADPAHELKKWNKRATCSRSIFCCFVFSFFFFFGLYPGVRNKFITDRWTTNLVASLLLRVRLWVHYFSIRIP